MDPRPVHRCLAPLIVLLLFCHDGPIWCVANQGAGEAALQLGLNYACGHGGADCSAIQPGGSCFDPDTVRDHASYAYNSYFHMKPLQTSCDFGGSAIFTTTDPSTSTCKYLATRHVNKPVTKAVTRPKHGTRRKLLAPRRH